ncbi:hypothetical protein FE257_008847 [Aspergillus nanangensis]|uniref:Transcription factor domain-containing protein n=1 Tax=Aspergillus nanangensis TaxID=2582783 RepID=A0AAD4CL20_ASPNN|nr:hypothetical protein FE257_008847 [Aspergillus nanangensis]
MCGLAGRMLMELGLHSRDASQHFLHWNQQPDAITTIVCSVIVLDRQWSAATGLPTNFHDASFDDSLRFSVKTPYLKAMVAFTLISDKFSEPISQVAGGRSYEDEDAFEIMNFQVDQWRTKVLAGHNFVHPASWEPGREAQQPSWTTLLYLRGNAVQSLLLRPFFLSRSVEAGRRKIESSLILSSDTIEVLSILDATTDIYHNQHPHFQHLLASACALLFLVMAHVEQNPPSSPTELPATFSDSMSRSLKMALSLAAAYRQYSPASCRLWKRLVMMRHHRALGVLGISYGVEVDDSETAGLAPSALECRTSYASSLPSYVVPCLGGARSPTSLTKQNGTQAHGPVRLHSSSQLPLSACPSSNLPGEETTGNAMSNATNSNILANIENRNIDASWTGSLFSDWSFGEVNGLFSESGL